MKSLDVKLPGSLKRFNLHQASALFTFMRSLDKDAQVNVNAMCQLISDITGQSFETVKRIDIADTKKIFKHIISCAVRKQQLPPKEIILSGKTYVFEQDISNSKSWTAGRYIDIDNKALLIETEPEWMMAICYIEKGSQYGDYSLDDRAEIMRKHLPGDVFVDAQDFFLRKLEQLKPGYVVLQIARSQLLLEKAQKIMQQNG